MTAPARARRARTQHFHLPSVHVRTERGDQGFDYEEDIYFHGSGRRRRVKRVITLIAIEDGQPALVRQTFDELCREEEEDLADSMEALMDEGDPEVVALMEDRARKEWKRQLRIAAGVEHACSRCGCSETRSCSGGCFWATATQCSRCV